MEGKESFIGYCEWLQVTEELTNEEAGQLFKHLLLYVNDKDPDTENKIIRIAFQPIKNQLKRDLKKWDNYIIKQRANGEKGGRPKNPSLSEKTQAFSEEPKKADYVYVNVNVNEDVNVFISEIKIEECLEISLKDERWIRKNNVTREGLLLFNEYLESQGKYYMVPKDYKSYFFHLKKKKPGQTEIEYTVDELKQMAAEYDKKQK